MFDAFRRDERAIEGLPIRLVIALVVGVASLSVMLNTLSGVQAIGVAEVDVKPEPEVTTAGEQEVSLRVVGPKGDPVSNATVVARGDTARLKSVATARTGSGGWANVTLDLSLGSNQEDGTVSFEVKPPAGGQYEDRRDNTDLLVVRR